MNKETENKLKILFRRVVWDYCHNNLNEEEVKSDVLDYIMDCKGGDNKFFENYIETYFDDITKQIRLETLKEVLPEFKTTKHPFNKVVEIETNEDCASNKVRLEIINKAKDNWGIIL